MSQQPRQISDEEFLKSFISQVRRLDLHIENVDKGKEFVRDDLAAVLRTLFCRGKGNDAIRRFCSRFQVKQPEVTVFPEIPNQGSVLFGFSGLTIEDDSGTNTLRLPDDLSQFHCVQIRHKQKVYRFTWEEVIEAYGNTFGSHLSTTIPELFDRIQIYGLGHVDLGTFLLRNFAVSVSTSCHKLVGKLCNERFPEHSQYFNGIQIGTVRYKLSGSKHNLVACIRKENYELAGRMIVVQSPDGEILEFSITDGGRLSLKVTKSA